MEPSNDISSPGIFPVKKKSKIDPQIKQINGFEIDLVKNCATQVVESTSGKKFLVTIPLNEKENKIESYLENFPLNFCQKVANLGAAMQLGEQKPQKNSHLNRLSLKVDVETREIKSLTKSYKGEKHQKQIIDPYSHFNAKLDTNIGNTDKLNRTKDKVDALYEMNEILILLGKKKEKEWSMFDHTLSVKPFDEFKPRGSKSRKNKNHIPNTQTTTTPPTTTTTTTTSTTTKPQPELPLPLPDSTDQEANPTPWYTRAFDYMKNLFSK